MYDLEYLTDGQTAVLYRGRIVATFDSDGEAIEYIERAIERTEDASEVE